MLAENGFDFFQLPIEGLGPVLVVATMARRLQPRF
jgi:hypothetical protein